jgi:hypothetical protein
MAEILLSSEAFVKSVTSASDNLSGKYILPSLREAQEIGLKGILGDALLSKLKELVSTNALDGVYKTLVDNCQYYLAYKTIVEVVTKPSYKIGNFGVAKSTDENLQVASHDEIAKVQYYYQSKADACCLDLQNFLLEHREDYPELSDNQCHKIQSNLYSAATCGVFLGGARGKTLPGVPVSRKKGGWRR